MCGYIYRRNSVCGYIYRRNSVCDCIGGIVCVVVSDKIVLKYVFRYSMSDKIVLKYVFRCNMS